MLILNSPKLAIAVEPEFEATKRSAATSRYKKMTI
jgi:hypothetical protein